jgi:hypothetical protein
MGAVGEGFYNKVFKSANREPVYATTSLVRITIRLIPGPPVEDVPEHSRYRRLVRLREEIPWIRTR